MKTRFTTSLLIFALCAASAARAQLRSATPAPKTDTVLLSETVDGNYHVRRYRVERTGDADYSVLYQINLSKLTPKLGSNTRQLDDLDSFVQSLVRDTLKQVRRIVITGYSSPDGPLALNQRLAKARMQDFLNYVNAKYDLSKRFDVKGSWVAEDWESCRILVDQSAAMPDRERVLAIIDGPGSSADKEARLKRMPAVWNYMKKNILPPLRRVEAEVIYGAGTIFEQRIYVAPPAPAPAPAPPTKSDCDCLVVDENISGIIVEMPE